jgi:hypothetical protein
MGPNVVNHLPEKVLIRSYSSPERPVRSGVEFLDGLALVENLDGPAGVTSALRGSIPNAS